MEGTPNSPFYFTDKTREQQEMKRYLISFRISCLLNNVLNSIFTIIVFFIISTIIK